MTEEVMTAEKPAKAPKTPRVRKPKASASKKEATNGKAARIPRTKPGEPRRLQVQILECLAKLPAIGSMSAGDIHAQVSPNSGWVRNFIGLVDPEIRLATEAKYKFTSLLTFGYIRTKMSKDSADKKQLTYQITAAGRKALEKATKE